MVTYRILSSHAKIKCWVNNKQQKKISGLLKYCLFNSPLGELFLHVIWDGLVLFSYECDFHGLLVLIFLGNWDPPDTNRPQAQ